MSQQTVRNFGLHGAIVVLLLITAAMTTFFATQNIGADAAGVKTKNSKTNGGKTTANPSFVITPKGGDTYKFTDNAPAVYSVPSANNYKVDFGNWTVQDTTTNTNLGTITGTISVQQGANNYTQTEESYIHPPISLLNVVNNTMSTYPVEEDPRQAAAYKADVAKGEVLGGESVSALGPSIYTMNQGAKTGVDTFAATSNQVIELGASSSVAAQALQSGSNLQNSAYNAAVQETSSTTPTQLLASNYGGGPRAVTLSKRPAIAPLVIMGVGLLISIAGLAVGSYCSFRNPSKPCSATTKGTTAIIGGLLTIVGGAVAGWSGAVYTGAAARAATAGQMATGLAETQLAVTEGSAATQAALTELQQQMATLSTAVRIGAA